MMKKFLKYLLIVLIASALAITFFFFKDKESIKKTDAIILNDSYSREAYLNLKGWDVTEIKNDRITVPLEFEGIYSKYAEIQQMQQLPLNEYKGKEAERYIYTLNNYNGNQIVYAELLVCENKLIAASLIGISPEQFIKEIY